MTEPTQVMEWGDLKSEYVSVERGGDAVTVYVHAGGNGVYLNLTSAEFDGLVKALAKSAKPQTQKRPSPQ